jgi:hypothetical protein
MDNTIAKHYATMLNRNKSGLEVHEPESAETDNNCTEVRRVIEGLLGVPQLPSYLFGNGFQQVVTARLTVLPLTTGVKAVTPLARSSEVMSWPGVPLTVYLA